MNNLNWSVRRELWENRSIYLAPLAAGGIVIAAFFMRLVRLPERVRIAQANGNLQQLIETPYVVSAMILMAIEIVVAVLYCLDALYGERRDRSVLFWKSMPVSDQTAVLAKAIVPVLVLPIVTWITTVVAQDVMLVLTNGMLAASGISAAGASHLSFSDIARIHFVHLVLFHGLWYAPLYAWLLLVSAWAMRLPFLWAVLPPLAIAAVERIAFNTGVIGRLMQWLFLGGTESLSMSGGPMTMETLMPRAGELLFGPGLWIRLAISAVMLFGAVRLRRSRGVI
jgi:ABC-2 type transport system permease protein